jgi:GntR family transcriptional regulator
MPIISIHPDDPRPIYRQIVDEVRRALVLGLVEADEALPSVRELAAELRVNPNTVQQAYRELEREGLAYVRRGRGTFVADVGTDRSERRSLARGVAERALRDAYRQGLTAEELLEAIRSAARSDDSEEEPS